MVLIPVVYVCSDLAANLRDNRCFHPENRTSSPFVNFVVGLYTHAYFLLLRNPHLLTLTYNRFHFLSVEFYKLTDFSMQRLASSLFCKPKPVRERKSTNAKRTKKKKKPCALGLSYQIRKWKCKKSQERKHFCFVWKMHVKWSFQSTSAKMFLLGSRSLLNARSSS